MERLRVRLRDVTEADANMLEDWNELIHKEGGFNDFGPRPPVARDVLIRGPLRNEHNGLMIVERTSDGVPIGSVSWRAEPYGPPPDSIAWSIGIELIPSARGYGYGVEAQRLVAEWLLANTAANRVEASTDIENIAEQRALEKAGFVREGIQRGAQFRAGAYHDLVTYSRLRDDP